MTLDQIKSEQSLFEESDQEAKELVKRTHRKRRSLGFRLPIKVQEEGKGSVMGRKNKGKNSQAGSSASNSPPLTSEEEAQEQERIDDLKAQISNPIPLMPPKGSTNMSSTLGFPGAVPTKEGSVIWGYKGSDGTDKTMNIFTTVFSDSGLTSEHLENILNYLNASGHLDFKDFIANIEYQGFDRLFYIKAALKKVSVSVFCRFAILGAVRGSNFEKIREKCLEMPSDLKALVDNKTIIKTAKRRDDLTILRFTASIPHWVAYWLFTVDIAKKIETSDCPAWLQFPGAASLPMGKTVRLQHIAFCKAFSALISGGSFNGNIYYTAFKNPIPVGDIPTMIKAGLGIEGANKVEIADAEVRSTVLMEVARVK